MLDRKLELRRLYDKTARLYDPRYEEIQRIKYSSIIPKLPSAKRILDLGCGTGMFLGKLMEFGKFVVGVDASLEMLKRAEQRSTGAILVLADADHLPFVEGCFDVVVSITLLQNMPNPAATVEEMARIVAHGGTLIMTTLKRKHSLDELESWVRKAGLRLLDSGEIENSEDLFCIAAR